MIAYSILLILSVILAIIFTLYNKAQLPSSIVIISCFIYIIIIPMVFIKANLISLDKVENFKSQSSSYDSNTRASLDVFYLNDPQYNKNKDPVCPNTCPGICSNDDKNKNKNFLKIKKQEYIKDPLKLSFNIKPSNIVSINANSSNTTFSVLLNQEIASNNSEVSVPKQLENGKDYMPDGLNAYYFTNDELNSYRGDVNAFNNNFANFNSNEDPKNYLNNFKKYLDNIPNNSFVILGLKGYANVCFNWNEQHNFYGNILNNNDNNYLSNHIQLMQELRKAPYNMSIFSNNKIITKDLPYLVLFQKVNNNFIVKQNGDFINSYEGSIIKNYKLIGQNSTKIDISKKGKDYALLKNKDLDIIKTIYDNKYSKCQFLYIRPITFSKFISIDSLNNQSFVFLSERQPGSKFIDYSNSPELKAKSFIEKSKVLLNNKNPQKWEIVPTDNCGYTNNVYIRTYDKPYYYLSANNKNISVSLTEGSSNQIWQIKKGSINNEFNIISRNSGMYLSYRDNQGYLDNNKGTRGSLFLSKLNNMKWSFIYSNKDKKIQKCNDKKIRFKDLMSPYDYPVVNNPNINVGNSNVGNYLNGEGRAYWNDKFNNVWNGQYIYYGTVDNKKNFLIINIQYDSATFLWKGTVKDSKTNTVYNVTPKGTNILSGKATTNIKFPYIYLEMIPTQMEDKGLKNTYPIKLKIRVSNDSNEIKTYCSNNSPDSGDVNTQNLDAYCVKVNTGVNNLIMTNWLESNGIPTAIKEADVGYKTITKNGKTYYNSTGVGLPPTDLSKLPDKNWIKTNYNDGSCPCSNYCDYAGEVQEVALKKGWKGAYGTLAVNNDNNQPIDPQSYYGEFNPNAKSFDGKPVKYMGKKLPKKGVSCYCIQSGNSDNSDPTLRNMKFKNPCKVTCMGEKEGGKNACNMNILVGYKVNPIRTMMFLNVSNNDYNSFSIRSISSPNNREYNGWAILTKFRVNKKFDPTVNNLNEYCLTNSSYNSDIMKLWPNRSFTPGWPWKNIGMFFASSSQNNSSNIPVTVLNINNNSKDDNRSVLFFNKTSNQVPKGCLSGYNLISFTYTTQILEETKFFSFLSNNVSSNSNNLSSTAKQEEYQKVSLSTYDSITTNTNLADVNDTNYHGSPYIVKIQKVYPENSKNLIWYANLLMSNNKVEKVKLIENFSTPCTISNVKIQCNDSNELIEGDKFTFYTNSLEANEYYSSQSLFYISIPGGVNELNAINTASLFGGRLAKLNELNNTSYYLGYVFNNGQIIKATINGPDPNNNGNAGVYIYGYLPLSLPNGYGINRLLPPPPRPRHKSFWGEVKSLF